MIKTVIGSFDSFASTSQVAADLMAAGFMQSDIHVLGNNATRVADDQCAGGSIGRLTAIGISETDAQYCAESLRRGGALVIVKVDSSRVDEAGYLIQRLGAIDIEDRVEQWKGAGWSGYDADANPYSFDQIEQERQRYAGRSQQQHRIFPSAR